MPLSAQNMTLTKGTKLFTVVLLLTIAASFGQTTIIPDGNFEQALIDLGYDSGALNGSIPTDNIKNVTTLNISNKNISDLTGIEDFEDLINLTCSSNNLINLDLSENTKLNKLICASNQLVSIDISKNTSLNWLDCSKNNISHLDLSKNTALISLYCHQNKLLNLNLSQNVLLTTLLCYRNELKGIDVSKNTALVLLFCANNKLTSLDVSNNVALRNLYCYSNQLKSIDVSQNTALLRLDCFRNELTELDVSQNIYLEHLYCYNNEISSLDLTENKALRIFNCSNNKLSSLNLNNGNNANIDRFFARNNADLNCITVDDPDYSTLNWINIDAQVTFSENCNPLGTNEFELNGLSIYPNPFQNELNIIIIDKALYTIANANGQIVLRGNLMIGDNKLNLAPLANGIYYLIIKGETDGMASKKILKY